MATKLLRIDITIEPVRKLDFSSCRFFDFQLLILDILTWHSFQLDALGAVEFELVWIWLLFCWVGVIVGGIVMRVGEFGLWGNVLGLLGCGLWVCFGVVV